MNLRRRLGIPGAIGLAGILLLLAGIALTTLESQMRIDAATAAVQLTPAQLEQLREVGVDDPGQDAYRDWLIIGTMTSGGRMPTLVLEVGDDEQSWSWGPKETSTVGSMGGWQPKPLTGVAAGGLALVIGSLFLAAARWSPRSSDASN